MMRLGVIKKAETYPVRIPFIREFRLSSGPYSPNTEYVLFMVETSEGVEGWGEASPMPAFSGIGQGEVARELKAAVALIEGEPLDVMRLMERLRRKLAPSPYSLCAIETALLDAVGKTLDAPLYHLLGGAVKEGLELAWPIGIGAPDLVLSEAERAIGMGFKELKLKVGGNLRGDVERVKALRERFPETPIRVDANQGYSREDAVRAGKAFASLGVWLFEQPVERGDLEGLRLVREACGLKVMADESCYNAADAYKLLSAEAVDVINIKIMKAGGLRGSWEVAAVSAAAGIANSLGSMLETGVGTAAGIHFAASCSNIKLRGEIVGPLFLEDDLIETPLIYDKGALKLPEGPGLGVAVDLKALEEYGAE